MKRIRVLVALLVFTAFVTAPAMADDLIIYPKKGQSEEQKEKDKFECYSWAKKETGFDPMEIPKATAPPPQKQTQKSSAIKGAAGGAAVGAVGGAIAGDAGKGAAAGAAVGGLLGAAKRQDQIRREEEAQKQWEQEQVGQYTQKRNTYNRAYSACLEARDYTVK